MKGAFFVIAKLNDWHGRGLPQEKHYLFDTREERDRRADELREEGHDVRTSDGI